MHDLCFSECRLDLPFCKTYILILRFLELDSVDLDLSVDELVDICDDSCALYIHENETGRNIGIEGGKCAGGTAWIHVKLALLLICLEFVGVSAYKNIAVKLP